MFDSKQKAPSHYMVIGAKDEHALRERVSLFLKKGWSPQGGVAVRGTMFFQAMIKPCRTRMAGVDRLMRGVKAMVRK